MDSKSIENHSDGASAECSYKQILLTVVVSGYASLAFSSKTCRSLLSACSFVFLQQPMFGLARAGLRSFATNAAPEGFVSASKAFKDSHPTWPWALGLSGSTLATGFVLLRFTLRSAQRDLDILRKDSNELVKSSIKQDLQLEQQGLQMEQITANLVEINTKLG